MASGRFKNFHSKLAGRTDRFLFERQTLNYLFTKLSGGAYRILWLRDNHRNLNIPKIYTTLVGGEKTSLVERLKFSRNLELPKMSSLHFGNDPKIKKMSEDVIVQVTPLFQRRIKTGIWQQPAKEADRTQHPTCLISYLQPQIQQFQVKP
ncbi:hypothetical protein TNCV_5137251 [Trichonephila clavipes]|nr:hypothetical protein TNCV_5137251 [Trichonephila clavipes]